jgi:DNA-binding NtrC family response regulator
MQIIGVSKAVQRIRAQAKQLSKSRKGLVLIGEEGVGKGAIAQVIHSMSADSKKPVIHLNLSGLDDGRVRKLIRGIIENREFRNPIAPSHGDFRLADGTTLIFEESEKSTPAVHQALGELLDASKSGKFDFRFAFSFSTPIEELYKKEVIPASLYDKIKQFERIEIPPLRERREDVVEFVKYFVKNVAEDLGVKDLAMDAAASKVLTEYDWMRNIQELKECIERSIVTTEGKHEFRLPDDLINELVELRRIIKRIESGEEFSIDSSMKIIEKRILERVLGKFDFIYIKAARFMRLSVDTMRYRMRGLGIPSRDDR